MFEFIAGFFVAFLILWVLFVNVMYVKNVLLIDYPQYKILIYIFVGPFAACAWIYDVLFNWTYGSIMFLRVPRELTLSSRLSTILKKEGPDSWRFRFAYFICQHIIEPWDQNHCGLDRL